MTLSPNNVQLDLWNKMVAQSARYLIRSRSARDEVGACTSDVHEMQGDDVKIKIKIHL